jgi:hypothetical protein
MPRVNFKYFALHYLELWLSKDRRFCKALAGGNETEKLGALKEAAAFYRVARNLAKVHDVEKQENKVLRYKPVLDVIDALDPIAFQGARLTTSIMEVERKISLRYGDRRVLSLTTKFLWLKMRSPILIYDSRARKALRARLGDIDDYYSRWRTEFDSFGNEINAACELLHKVHEYSAPNAATPRYIQEIASQLWFKERVFDVYLWDSGGGSDGKNQTEDQG